MIMNGVKLNTPTMNKVYANKKQKQNKTKRKTKTKQNKNLKVAEFD